MTAGASAAPVPLRAAVCGEPLALSTMVKVALSLPTVEGVKVTAMEQVAFAATLAPAQVSAEIAKSLLVTETLAMVSAAVPELVSVML